MEDHTEVEVLTVTERNNSKSEDEHVMEPKGKTVSDEEAKKASGEKTSCSKGQSEYEKIRARNIKEREDLLTTLIADVSDYKRDAGIGSRKLSGKRKKGQCQFDNEEQMESRKSKRLALKAKPVVTDSSEEEEAVMKDDSRDGDELIDFREAQCNSDAKFEGTVKRVGSGGEFWAGEAEVLGDRDFRLDEWLLWQGPQRRQLVGEGALSATLRRLLSQPSQPSLPSNLLFASGPCGPRLFLPPFSCQPVPLPLQ